MTLLGVACQGMGCSASASWPPRTPRSSRQTGESKKRAGRLCEAISLTNRRDCKIINHPKGMSELQDHPTGKWEVVLQVRRPPQFAKPRGLGFEGKTFASRALANKQGVEH